MEAEIHLGISFVIVSSYFIQLLFLVEMGFRVDLLIQWRWGFLAPYYGFYLLIKSSKDDNREI